MTNVALVAVAVEAVEPPGAEGAPLAIDRQWELYMPLAGTSSGPGGAMPARRLRATAARKVRPTPGPSRSQRRAALSSSACASGPRQGASQASVTRVASIASNLASSSANTRSPGIPGSLRSIAARSRRPTPFVRDGNVGCCLRDRTDRLDRRGNASRRERRASRVMEVELRGRMARPPTAPSKRQRASATVAR